MKTPLVVFCGLVFGVTHLAGQEVIASDRPGIGSAATVLSAGTFQLELGMSLSRASQDAVYGGSLGEGLLRIGLRGFELEVFLNSFALTGSGDSDTATSGSGFEDFGVGAKVPLVVDAGDRFSLSAQGILTAPTGSDLFTNDEWVGAVNLLADLGLSDASAVSVNAGYQAGPGDLDGVFTFFVTPAIVLRSGVGLYAGWAAFLADGPDSHFVEGGITFPKGNDVQLDLNGGWDAATDDFFAGVGVAVRRR